MLFKRWITAIILIPFLLLILLKGNSLAFSLLITVIAFVSMKEYFTIVSSFNQSLSDLSCNKTQIKIKICGYVASLLIIIAAHNGSSEIVLLISVLNVMVVFIAVLRDFSSEATFLGDIANEIQGIIYIPVFLSSLVFIRNSPNGAAWIIWLWLIIGASDTGAYYCGTYFGKNPLAPKISPNKTIEGAAGGIAVSVIVGILFGLIYIPDISLVMLFLFAFIAAAAGQLGDLFESALKRAGCIKDSGVILPGHGGLLDRIDGLIFAAPIAFIFKFFIANM